MKEESVMARELDKILAEIAPLDKGAMNRVRARVDNLTKPRGSLGRMEDLAVQLAGIHGDFPPRQARKRVVVMAADHGVAAEGVSAYPSEVTAQMVANFAAGGAAINVLGALGEVEVAVVDVGVTLDVDLPAVKKVRVRAGTGNMLREAAMTRGETLEAILAGVACAEEAYGEGVSLLATGEMGIGNTTASSAVMAAITGYEPALVVGRGTGLDEKALQHKREVVAGALARHRPPADDPLAVLSLVGGLEIAALAGLIIGAARRRIPLVIDGFISSTAALVAVEMAPRVRDYLVPSHLSSEAGHALLLDYLGLTAYINMGMRLGEGTGAVLAMHLVDAASRIVGEMATFEQAGVSDKDGEKASGKAKKEG